MDIFFTDPETIPLPPSEVRITQLEATPYPDGRRVHVLLCVTPFQVKPNADLAILDEEKNELASISIIESLLPRMEVNIHLPESYPNRTLYLQATLYYSQIEDPAQEGAQLQLVKEEVDHTLIQLTMPASSDASE